MKYYSSSTLTLDNVKHTETAGASAGTQDREDYERDLKRRQKEHLDHLNDNQSWHPCMHDACPECVGTGIKKDGGSCIHMISCPCPKCSPSC